MKSEIIIVADRGHLRAYRQSQNAIDRRPHWQLIDGLNPATAHEKRSDQVTDQAGCFPRIGGADGIPGDLSPSESFQQKGGEGVRLIQQLAGKINALLADAEVTTCLIAISASIHQQLVDALEPRTRKKLRQVLASNLATIEPTELLGHFEKANPLVAQSS